MHSNASHKAEHLFVGPSPCVASLVPEMRTHILLKFLLGWRMGEGIGVSVTQHEPGDRERIGKRRGRDGTWHTRKRKIELPMTPHHSGHAIIEIVGGRTEVFEHAITSRIWVFEDHDQHTIRGELIGSVNRIGAPFMIGHVVKDMTDETNCDRG
jgi:hypothetical protein